MTMDEDLARKEAAGGFHWEQVSADEFIAYQLEQRVGHIQRDESSIWRWHCEATYRGGAIARTGDAMSRMLAVKALKSAWDEAKAQMDTTPGTR